MRYLIILIIVICISACSQKKPDSTHTFKKEYAQKPPVIIKAKAPFVTLLDTCPSPHIISIPQKTSDAYYTKNIVITVDGPKAKTVQLLPPEKRPSDFFIPMQSFTTRDGLAYNTVQRGCVDKHGNLWFCTYGGGVSRFDGKSFTNFTTVQGLASNIVWNAYEDKAGNLWFGTDGNGVSCYDGKSFKTYTTAQGLADNLVWAITEDKNANMWFGTGAGLSRLNKDRVSFHNDTTAAGFRRDNISCMLQDKAGNIWYGTWGAGGVTCYDGKTYQHYTVADGLADNFVTSICQDKDGNLWTGNRDGKVSFLATNKKMPGAKISFTTYAIADGLVGRVQAITEDKKGNLWFGTDDGACRLDCDKKLNPDKESFTSITTKQGLLSHNVNSIMQDSSGNIWFGIDNGGVSVLKQDLKSLTTLTINDKQLHNVVTSVIEDKFGNIWLGTIGEGALRISRDGKSVLRFNSSQGLPSDYVFNTFEDKAGNFWFNCGYGISRLDKNLNSVTTYSAAHGLPGPENWVINVFEDSNGNLWLGTVQGGACCLRFSNKSLLRYTAAQGLPDNTVKKIFEDEKGNLWFGTPNGLSRLDRDGKTFTNYTTDQGLTGNDVTSIVQDKNGNIWIGTGDRGVSRYDGRSFKSFTTTQGLPSNNVKGIVIDKQGLIWLGTDKGFAILKSFDQVTKSSLHTSSQESVQPCNELSNAELEQKFKPVLEIYNIRTGYPIEEISSSFALTREGVIWAGTGNNENIVRFDYARMNKNTRTPDVIIQSIKINNEDVSWYDLRDDQGNTDNFMKTPNGMEELTRFGKLLGEDERQVMRKKFRDIKFDSITDFYPVPENLVLPYERNNITFDFISIEPVRPGTVRYQYMMEGYEKDWSPISDKTSATYGNMHEGNYSFIVKAQSADGVWSKPLTYNFKVLPPWYRSWWFIITAVGCLATFFYLVIRWRLQQKFRLQLERSEKEKQVAEIKQKNAELQQRSSELEMQALRAQMNPHFIFNCLNSINMFIVENNKQQASDYLAKFSRLIRLILQNSEKAFISLDRELEALRLYLELESLRFEKRFEYEVSVINVDTTMVKIPPLIIQPYAENAIWHGLMHKKEKGHLKIELYLDEMILFCKISDDGVGRRKAAELKSKSALTYKSMGMQISADRIAILQQQEQHTAFITIDDLVLPDGSAAGTEVLIKIPQ